MSTNALEIERVRHRAAEALEKGLGFIVRHGAEMTVLRAHVLLGAEPVERLSQHIAQQQTARGSFPPLGLVAGGALSFSDQFQSAGLSEEVGGTLETLSALSDLGELHAPCVELAARFLGEEQAEDGGWGRVTEPLENRLFVTGQFFRNGSKVLFQGGIFFLSGSPSREEVETLLRELDAERSVGRSRDGHLQQVQRRALRRVRRMSTLGCRELR